MTVKTFQAPTATIAELSDRSRTILSQIVETYMKTGDPVGSRTLSRRLPAALSPATIRNVMADLEEAGLLYAPHTSAGRLPTEAGLRLFVDGLLEVGNLPTDERRRIEATCAASGQSLERLLGEATAALSGLSRCASLVAAPKTERPLKHIEFVRLSAGRALVIMVTESGIVENRVIEVPVDLPVSALIEASNYLGARLIGRTLDQTRDSVLRELAEERAELDALTRKVVEAGLAVPVGEGDGGSLIVRGQAHLLEDVTAVADLERIRGLFEALETKETLLRLLNVTHSAGGVQIFIGSENPLFSLAGCSMVVAPFRNGQEQIVGAIGVIGPTRINYARIIPLVDFTAKLIGKSIG